MAEIFHFTKRNIQQISTKELIEVWNNWDGEIESMFHPVDMESVYFELNMRGEGKHCAI